VGGVTGWLLDNWLGTMPLFLIICFLLGFAGGLLNMKRVAEQLDSDGQSATTPAPLKPVILRESAGSSATIDPAVKPQDDKHKG
jgi:hypothetical protein